MSNQLPESASIPVELVVEDVNTKDLKTAETIVLLQADVSNNPLEL